MVTDALTNEQWLELFERLEGPEGCNFKEEPDPDRPGETKTTWRCKGGMDKRYAEKILSDMGIRPPGQYGVLRYVESLGGHCDCEILFNAAERVCDDLGIEPNPFALTPEEIEQINQER